jgi:inner membrane transporter RhtA
MQSLATPTNPNELIFRVRLSSLLTSIAGGFGYVQRLEGYIPPSGLVLLSCFAIQISNAFAKTLFEALGSIGAAFACKALAAILLWLICRPKLENQTYREYFLVVWLGVAIAVMTLAMYGAIARIPMGIASTLDFLGPLGVAVIGSRRPLDLVWIAFAAIGVILLNPINNTSLDPIGIGLALLSGACWAAYIILSNRVGRVFPGKVGLALAMAVAAFLTMPLGVSQAGEALLQPKVFFVGITVAILGTVLPYSMEYTALKRLPPRIFGVLMSIEPAIAALVGFLFLGEVLNFRAAIAIASVTVAAMGITLFGRQDTN